MKKIGIIMMFVAMFGATSCGSLSGASNTAAATSGAACAQALLALNKSKKAGTLAITNPADLSNILLVINAYNGLRSNKEDASYKKSFTTGMVTGSAGTINAGTALNITNSLLNSAGLEGVNSANIAQKAQTVSTIIQLLTLLQQ